MGCRVHPQEHLGASKGILQADAYAGFRDLYTAEGNGEARFKDAADRRKTAIRKNLASAGPHYPTSVARPVMIRVNTPIRLQRFQRL